jgi:predicted nucleic acid-binding Zn ribbon protein
MKKVGDVLSAFFDETTVEKAKTFSALFGCWESLTTQCGLASAASHSRIATFEHGMLLVEAEHPTWIHLLQTKQRDLLEKFRVRFADLGISGISFRLMKSDPYAKYKEQPGDL